jgi:multidrug efflux pump subunit AcrB
VLDDAVTSVIEQEMNGADGLQYVESQSEANGAVTITVTFVPGTNPDLAAVDVQNRIKRVESRLPAAVTQQGVQVNKARSNILMFVGLTSTDGRLDRPRWATTWRATWSTKSSAFPAWARRSCSAPSAPCASGSIRKSWSA